MWCSPSGSEEETFVFPQSNETEQNRGTSDWKNNTGDATLSNRSTQTDPGMWTPEKKDKRGNYLNSVVHASPERRVRMVSFDWLPAFVRVLILRQEGHKLTRAGKTKLSCKLPVLLEF